MPKRHLFAAIVIATIAIIFGVVVPALRAPAAPKLLQKDLTIQTSFLPSKNGFAFRNPRPDPRQSKLKQLTSGRCGGMTFGALDVYDSAAAAPKGASLDRFLAQRSIDSILSNGARFAAWSVSPNVSRNPLLHGIGQTTRLEEMSKIINDLRSAPVPLGLVRATSLSRIGLNHQVVAYKLIRKGDRVAIYVYDSCQPKADDVTLRIDLSRPQDDIREYAGDTVVAEWRGLFVESYTPARVPAS